ncbi:MAG: hypothetical protein AAF515_05050 [Pseudomonadota bacterium]
MCGDDGVIRFGTTAIAETRGWAITESAGRIAHRAQGQPVRYKAQAVEYEGTITAALDPTDLVAQNALVVGATVGLQLYPGGIVSGLPQWAIDAVLTQQVTTSEVENVVLAVWQWAGAGALSKGLVA